jgi:multiple sugar transport system ATP-binding protein
MDEPLSNLDAKLRAQMRVEIAKLHKSLETTIIYVTHDQTEAMTLGTRIVVMKDGVIQQVDTPENLYDTPCNKFVAGFIGSPQMNMIDAECKEENGDVTLTFAGHTIALSAEKAAKLKEGGYVGKTVTLGIRPEHLHDDADFVAAHAKQTVTSEIKVYEMLGAETLLYFDLGDASWVARVNPKTKARTGSTVTFALDESKIHVFDKETEKTITN